MATQSNFLVKVKDAKLKDIMDALKEKQIDIASVIEIHKEEQPEAGKPEADKEEK